MYQYSGLFAGTQQLQYLVLYAKHVLLHVRRLFIGPVVQISDLIVRGGLSERYGARSLAQSAARRGLRLVGESGRVETLVYIHVLRERLTEILAMEVFILHFDCFQRGFGPQIVRNTGQGRMSGGLSQRRWPWRKEEEEAPAVGVLGFQRCSYCERASLLCASCTVHHLGICSGPG